MEVRQPPVVDFVITLIFGSIGKKGPIRSHTGRDQWFHPSGTIFGAGPEFITGVDSQAYCVFQLGAGLLDIKTLSLEAGDAGLVGGGGDAVRSCGEEIMMYFGDGSGIIEKDPGGPEIIVQIKSPVFQGGGQATGQDDGGLIPQDRQKWVSEWTGQARCLSGGTATWSFTCPVNPGKGIITKCSRNSIILNPGTKTPVPNRAIIRYSVPRSGKDLP